MGPFYNNVSGTVTAAPATAAFTPTGASANSKAWSLIPAAIVFYRADEGATWETGYGYWNGTTLTRAVSESSNANALVSFGTGVVIQAAIPAGDVQPHIGGGRWVMLTPSGSTAMSAFGYVNGTPTAAGTASSGIPASTNYLTRQWRVIYSSATTANAVAGQALSNTAYSVFPSTTPLVGGFEFIAQCGWSAALPVAHRIQVGMANTALAATAAEPSSIANHAAFVKDSTDTNFFLSCRNATLGTRLDTGIAPVLDAAYEFAVWSEPGQAGVVWGSITRKDTGLVWIGSINTNTPAVNTAIFPVAMSGITATTGTASTINLQSVYLRNSA